MLPTVPPSEFLIAWSTQTALSAGMALSTLVLAVTFRRPAMRTLAAFFALTAAASALLWTGLAAADAGMPPYTASLLAAFVVPLSPILSGLLGWHVIRLLSGRTERAFPPGSVLATVGVAALCASLALNWLTWSAMGGGRSIIGVLGSMLAIICYLGLGAYAFRIWRDKTDRRVAIGLMGFAFTALAVRSIANLTVAAIAVLRGELPRFGVWVTLLQVFLLVAAGALQIIAVLEDERVSSVRRTEQVGLAELAVARSQRLESVGRMSGAIAHDFNNLLAVIGMSAESARATPRDAAGDLDAILGATKRGQELTRQLLAFARQAPQEVTRFDVSHQVNKLGELLKRMAGKERSLVISVAPTAQVVEMDVTQFEQVLINLVVNARDASASGGQIEVVVVSTAAASHPDSRFVRFSVTDNGAGISSEVLPSIFEPFFSTKTVGEGSGLGLATCDSVVRRAGGRIEVATELDHGTRFDVYLPRAHTSLS